MSFSTESSDVNTTVASSDAQQNKSADGSIRGSITTSHAALVLDRKKTATIWTYCVLASNKTTDHTDSVGRPIWICKPCSDKKVSKFFLVSGGTASMYRHLRKFHQINPPGATKQINTATLNTLKNCKDWTDMEPPVKRRKTAIEVHDLNGDELRELFSRYVSQNNLPLSHCESPSFRALLQYCNPAANQLLPRCSSTIKANLERSYVNKKAAIKQELQSSLSSIHLAPDGWSSPNGLGLLGVVAHFVSAEYGLQHLTLGIKEILGEHGGENMGEMLYKLAEDYGITSKVGYLMMDNAHPNNTMIRELGRRLNEREINYNPETRRLRCMGHVINLSVLAFLYGNHPDGVTRSKVKEWRLLGPIGKLHNIVIYVQTNPQRKQAFRALSKGVNLHRDNGTRWNSWYEMIQWSCKDNIKAAIQQYVANNAELQDEMLYAEDWKDLASIRDFLKLFFIATKSTESPDHSIGRIIPIFDRLLSHYEKSRTVYKDSPLMRTCLETGWSKLEKYYVKSDQSPAYVAAVVLDPSWKWSYFKQHWQDNPDWIAAAQMAVENLWITEYKSTCPILGIHSTLDNPLVEENEDDRLFLRRRPTAPAMDDEYVIYINEAVLDIDALPNASPLEYWASLVTRRRFPNLSLMALDILSIPAMSAHTERLFSQCKLTISDQRCALQADTVELLQCIKSWDQSSILLESSTVCLLINLDRYSRLLTCY
jgi:hypothetical protein